MATLIFTALGTLVGGPLGGVLGAIAGQQIDNAILGGKGTIQGSRLSDLTVSTSSYGTAVPRYFGQMRAGGSIIWATDLVEHSSTTSTGKNSPSVTTYSYTSSFAVALASRPILRVGRIWADGNLLRGAAGDLKVGGTLRIYTGGHTQAVDPLIASAEGASACPAFRGLAYVVFEDLQLADYGNRIPTLSFEIFADEGTLFLSDLFDGVLDDVDADVPLTGIAGYSSSGTLDDTLSQFTPMFPMACDAGGTALTITRQRLQTTPIALAEPALSPNQGDFGATTGYARQRSALPETPPRVLRYYDVALDYQAGSQRAPGQPQPGQPKTIELPAALQATDAFRLITQAARDTSWARETMNWRCAELDPSVAPGALVTLQGQPGLWRVDDWEWRETGVELTLERVAPASLTETASTDAGKANLAADLLATPTQLAAFEVPWDGTGSADSTNLCAAVSSAGAGWSGAGLYADIGDGSLVWLGSSGRMRSLIGTTVTALPAASPLLFDRSSSLDVTLVGNDLALTSTTMQQLALGANRALVGSEIIQFATATALGSGTWRLSGFLRGRGGTENAVDGHGPGESFVLLDGTPVALDASRVGQGSTTRIAALGLADSSPVEAAIACRGISLQPLSPVHPSLSIASNGDLQLGWTRRARGGWLWLDGVDEPLVEESEAYLVTFGALDNPTASWTVSTAALTVPATILATLAAAMPGGAFQVQQNGTYALSQPLLIGTLPST